MGGKDFIPPQGLEKSWYGINPSQGAKAVGVAVTVGPPAPPWLSGWNYRKSHVIVGSTAGAQTNYQVKVIVHKGSGSDSGADVYTNNHCLDDFGDVRFTKDDKITQMDYWMESKVDADNAVFWVEIPSIPANPDTVTIYIYYGKASTATTSNGPNTFTLFDDFEDGSFDTGKWVKTEENGGTVTESGGKLSLTCGAVANQEASVRSISTYLYKALRFRAKYPTGVYRSYQDIGYNGSTDLETIANGLWGLVWDGDNGQFRTAKAGTSTATSLVIGKGTTYTYEITWKNGQGKLLRSDSVLATHTTNIMTTACYATGSNWTHGTVAPASGHTIEIEWMLVREWVDPEPSHSTWGSEESA